MLDILKLRIVKRIYYIFKKVYTCTQVLVENTPLGSDDTTGEKAKKYCSISNDPHFRTIDGR